jgi:hypothetical protein
MHLLAGDLVAMKDNCNDGIICTQATGLQEAHPYCSIVISCSTLTQPTIFVFSENATFGSHLGLAMKKIYPNTKQNVQK